MYWFNYHSQLPYSKTSYATAWVILFLCSLKYTLIDSEREYLSSTLIPYLCQCLGELAIYYLRILWALCDHSCTNQAMSSTLLWDTSHCLPWTNLQITFKVWLIVTWPLYFCNWVHFGNVELVGPLYFWNWVFELDIFNLIFCHIWIAIYLYNVF